MIVLPVKQNEYAYHQGYIYTGLTVSSKEQGSKQNMITWLYTLNELHSQNPSTTLPNYILTMKGT